MTILSDKDPGSARGLVEELFLKMFHATDSLMAVSTVDEGRFVSVNDAFVKKTGYTRDEIVGKTSAEINLFVNYADRATALDMLHAKGVVTGRRVDIRTKSGTVLKGFFNVNQLTLEKKPYLLAIYNDMTETVDAMKALEESEERYRTLAESSLEMIYMVDAEGVVRYVNPAGYAMFGGGYDAVVGKHLRDLFPAAIAERHLKDINAVIAAGQPFSSEMVEQFPTGSCWIDARLTPMKNSGGKIIGVLGISADITERKKQEDRMLVQRDLGIALSSEMDLACALTLCLDAALKICGMDCGGIYLFDDHTGDLDLKCHRGLSEEFIASVAHFPAVSPNVAIVRAGPVYSQYADLLKQNDDSKKQEGLHAIAVLPFYHENRVIGCLNIASHSIEEIPESSRMGMEIISGQIGNEVGRFLAEQALRESEERFRIVFEQARFGMALSDKDFRFFRVNDSFCAMFGYSAEEFAAMSFKDITQPSFLEADLENIKKLIDHEITLYKTEKKYVKKSGEELWGDITLSLLRNTKGEFHHFLVIVEDITVQKRVEEELQKTQKLEALGVLAGGIAHDFNNLLSGLFGYMDLARVTMQPHGPAAEYLNNAFQVFERSKGLTRQLLTFSKGGAPLKKTISLAEILRECGNFAVSGTNIKVEYLIHDTLQPVDGDENQLSQVFSNLLINAGQAMPEGGVVNIIATNRIVEEKTVIVPLPAGEYVQILVQDNGIGIPEKIIQRIFDPFFTTKQTGSGLGLAISYSIVKKHGGHIFVVSSPGKGSVFSILLPVSKKNVKAAVKPGDTTIIKGTGSILVMDDDAPIRKIMQKLLTKAGYDVTMTSNGSEAVEKYRHAFEEKQPFDLVILDLIVPGGMGGEKAMAELRKIDPSVVAMVSSGYTDGELMTNWADMGFESMIPKPYRMNELLAAVKAAVEKDRK